MKTLFSAELMEGRPLNRLEVRLLECGIPFLNPAEVEAHQKEMLYHVRRDAGALQIAAWWTVRKALEIFSLHAVLRIVNNHIRLHPYANVGTVVVLFLLGAVGTLAGYPLASLLLVPLPAGLVHDWIFAARGGGDWKFHAQNYGARWVLLRAWDLEYQVPRRLHQRASMAASLPGVRVFVEMLEDDPFLAAIDGYGPWQAKAYIGAWDTGQSDFDRH